MWAVAGFEPGIPGMPGLRLTRSSIFQKCTVSLLPYSCVFSTNDSIFQIPCETICTVLCAVQIFKTILTRNQPKSSEKEPKITSKGKKPWDNDLTKTAIFEMFKTWWCLFLFAISCTKFKMIMKVVTFFWINYTRLKKSKNLVYVVNLVWTNPISKIQGFENCLYVYLHGIWRQRKLMATLRSLINVQCTLINFLKKSSLHSGRRGWQNPHGHPNRLK